MEISGSKKCYFPRCFSCFSMRNCMLMDVAGRERKWRKSAPGRNRTCDLALRRHSLYPLSYRGRNLEAGAPAPAQGVVEEKGIEPSTFALRTRRSPN
jgi:hypothetical protein